mmetsp:Transcript_21115/g.72675  ORF Transcript_21115/g.72675 Transcript_21115/m.72675 type:complete len:259 (+) Transcript_21115:268-1044(+)
MLQLPLCKTAVVQEQPQHAALDGKGILVMHVGTTCLGSPCSCGQTRRGPLCLEITFAHQLAIHIKIRDAISAPGNNRSVMPAIRQFDVACSDRGPLGSRRRQLAVGKGAIWCQVQTDAAVGFVLGAPGDKLLLRARLLRAETEDHGPILPALRQIRPPVLQLTAVEVSLPDGGEVGDGCWGERDGVGTCGSAGRRCGGLGDRGRPGCGRGGSGRGGFSRCRGLCMGRCGGRCSRDRFPMHQDDLHRHRRSPSDARGSH